MPNVSDIYRGNYITKDDLGDRPHRAIVQQVTSETVGFGATAQLKIVLRVTTPKGAPWSRYDWVSPGPGGNKAVKWVPGSRSRVHPNVIAETAEGMWLPAIGYTWLNNPPTAGDFRVNPVELPSLVKPSYCSNVTTKSALRAQIICADSSLSYVDFRYEQAYLALEQERSENAETLSDNEKVFSDKVDMECGVTRFTVLSPSAYQKRCIQEHYEQQRQQYLTQLQSPEAIQEAVREPDKHIRLQKYLCDWFQGCEDGPGRYGDETRSAISTWQAAHKLPITGLLGNNDAAVVERELGASAPPAVNNGPQASPYDRGYKDRLDWEYWVAGVSGTFKGGAIWWAGQRSLPQPSACNGPAALGSDDFVRGCEVAKARLTPTDIQRKSDPLYREGWNSYTPE